MNSDSILLAIATESTQLKGIDLNDLASEEETEQAIAINAIVPADFLAKFKAQNQATLTKKI